MSKTKERISTPISVVPAREDKYLTAADVAERLHVSRETVLDWSNEVKMTGKIPLPSKPVSKKLRLFYWSEVQAWVDAGGVFQRRKRAA